jgi:hypothetical protein
MSKNKFFAWLILQDRINIRDMLLRRHWTVDSNHNFVLCPCKILEDWSHLFFEYNFSIMIWSYLQINWGNGSSPEMLKYARTKFMGACFVEIVILACWCIWKRRNECIFRGIRPTFRYWRAWFIYEFALLKHRVKPCIVSALPSWLDTLL